MPLSRGNLNEIKVTNRNVKGLFRDSTRHKHVTEKINVTPRYTS